MGNERIHLNNYDAAIAKKCEVKTTIDKIVKYFFLLLATLSIVIVLITVIYLIYSGIRPFFATYENGTKLDIGYFFTGTKWENGNYGVFWIFVNTVYLTLLSLIISAPLGILTGIFITRIAPKTIGNLMNSVINVLAGIPSVIIGVFGVGFICPMVYEWGKAWGIQTAGGKSGISAILVLALMSLPTIVSMSVTAIKAVDKRLILSSLALGASPAQTNFKIVLIDAQSGIFAGVILGMGRAIGEATAIQMVTGATSGPNFNIFSNTATLTTVMLKGIGEARPGSLNYEARFSAGLILILVIISTNVILNAIRDAIYRKRNGIVRKPKKSHAIAAGRTKKG